MMPKGIGNDVIANNLHGKKTKTYLYICNQWLAISKASSNKKMNPGLQVYFTLSSENKQCIMLYLSLIRYKQVNKAELAFTDTLERGLPEDKQCLSCKMIK